MPIPVNPLKQLRLSKNWSLDQVADSAELSRLLIIRSEQGCYKNIPPKLLDFYQDVVDFDLVELNLSYVNFQVLTRQSNYGLLPVGFLRIWPEKNPFTALRKVGKVSMAQVYKGFCVHPTILHKLENQPNLCATIPSDLLKALTTAGYPVSWLAHYVNWYGLHKQWLADQVEISA